MFEVEAYDVLDQREGEGVDVKMVARKIKFVREIKIDGHRNMGYRNTGYRNTGYRNTGDRNTGDRNTGDRNTGDGNTGDGNTGYRNTGYGNTGDGNTGDGNTGDRNTGYRNTGDGNTGDGNTGHWNAVNYSTGFFCLEESKAISFDLPTEISRQDFLNRPDVTYLGDVLMQDEPIDWEKVKTVPNITIEKLNELHTRFVQARKGENDDEKS
jgi:hypothetical protein